MSSPKADGLEIDPRLKSTEDSISETISTPKSNVTKDTKSKKRKESSHIELPVLPAAKLTKTVPSAAAGSPNDLLNFQPVSPLMTAEQWWQTLPPYFRSYEEDFFYDAPEELEDEPSLEEEAEEFELAPDFGPEGADDIPSIAQHLAGHQDELGPAISEKLSKLVQNIWQSISSWNIREVFDRYKRPANLEIHKVDMNTEIISTINKTARSRDIKLRSAQGALAKAVTPLTQIMDWLLKGGSRDKQQLMVDAAVDTLKFISHANTQINQSRRELLKPSLAPKYHGLCREGAVTENTPYLLGSDISERIRAINQAVNIGRHRSFYGNSFRSRGRAGYSYAFGLRGRHFAPGKCFQNICNIKYSQKILVPKSSQCNALTTSFSRRTETTLETGSSQGHGDGQSGQEIGRTADPDFTQVSLLQNIEKKWDKFEAGRASKCYEQWSEITSDYNMLKEIKGHRIEFTEMPVQHNEPRPMKFNAVERKFVYDEIQSLLAKGVLTKVDPVDGQFLSNIFLRPKKDTGKFRMILNLKTLNKFIDHQHFKMDTFDSALRLINRCSFMASLDLADAYYTLKIHEADRKYLRFKFEDQIYEFTCVPNGIKSGPRLFTKLMKIPLAALRKQHNVIITGYIDDTLIVANSQTQCIVGVKHTAELLQKLGFSINWDKSELVPTTKLQYLGYVIDSDLMKVTLPVRKIENIHEMVQDIIKHDSCTIRTAAQVAGSLIATIPANKFAPLFVNQLEIEKSAALRQNAFNFDATMSISQQCKEQLQWWLIDLDKTEQPVYLGDPDDACYFDASNEGWGVYHPQTQTKFGLRWNEQEKELHINAKELLAIFHGLRALYREAGDQEQHIRVFSDNTTAVFCIRNQGSLHSPVCNAITRDIWLWAIDNKKWLSTAHCPGILNVEADEASRKFADETEWALQPSIFHDICKIFGTPDIDLFASRNNKQVDCFCSWKPDPDAFCIDSFSINWANRFCYAFPPFAILPAVIQKWQMDGAFGILIVPNWPTKPWFSKIQEMLCAQPVLLHVTDKLLFLPSRPLSIHPMVGRLQLLGLLLSPDPYRIEDFLQMWRKPCSTQDANHQPSYIDRTTHGGKSIVVQGVSIPFKEL